MTELETIKKQVKKNITELINQNKLEQAQNLLSQYFEMVKDDAEAFSLQAIIYIYQKSLDAADETIKHGLSISQTDFDLLYNLGYITELRKDYQKARNLYQQILLNSIEEEKQSIVNEALKRINLAQPMKKQKLAFICIKGLDSFIHDISRELDQKYIVQKFILENLNDIPKAIKWADIVWLEWGNESTIAATQYQGIANKKVIVRIHGYEVFTDMPTKIKWNVVDKLIFVAEHKRKLFFNQFGEIIAKDKTCIIRNGIDSNKFSIAVNKTKNKNIACIGYINYRKGIDLLLQFFYELLQVDDEYRLYIRGTHQDLRYQVAIDTMIKELGIQNKVIFVGRVENINKWLADMTYIVSSSLEESFHYSIGEGMLAGLKPVVHAWTESRDIWPQEYIFKNSAEFKQIILDSSYNPTEYRQFVLDHYALSKQMGEINDIITTSK